MPSGSKKPDVQVYSKEQSGPWDFDSQLRGKVQIAAVSAGLTLPVTGALTVSLGTLTSITVNNTAGEPVPVQMSGASSFTVNNTSGDPVPVQIGGASSFTVNNTAGAPVPVQIGGASSFTVNNTGGDPVPVSIRGGTTPQDVRLAAVSTVTLPVSIAATPMPVSIRGGTTDQDIRIAGVLAGVTVPVSIRGGTTPQDVRLAAVSSVTLPVSIAATVPVSIRGGTTPQDVRLAAVSSVTLPVSIAATIPVSIRGGTTDQDVRIAAAITTVAIKLVINCSYGVTTLTTSGAGTKVVVAAQGGGTATQVRGFSICNEGTTARRFEMRFGNTAPFWRGSLPASGGAFNWNMIGQPVQGSVNQKVVAYINGAGTLTATVYWKKGV